MMILEPYLFFEGRCEEAIEFYKKAIGAEVEMLMYFKDSPDPESCGPGMEDKVMHATLKVGDTKVMMSDGMCQGEPSFQGISLSLRTKDVSQVERIYAALKEGGQEQMPLATTFFSPKFGMVADKYGVSWMLMAEGEQPQ